MKHPWKQAAALLMAGMLCAASAETLAEETVDVLLNTGTTQAFTADAVPEEDLNTLLEAGLSATSAINQQPWYFVVVTNQEVMSQIADASAMGAPDAAPAEDAQSTEDAQSAEDDAGETQALSEDAADAGAPAESASAKAALGDSPVAIIIYMDSSTASPNPDFDCGLACQNMVVAASALGYGTKIVSSPTMALNGEDHDALCEQLGVDTSLNAVAVLLLGVPDTEVDGYAGASQRSLLEEKVSFVE